MSFSVCHQFPAIAWGHIRSFGTEKPDLEYQPVTCIFRPFFICICALLRFNIWAGALTGGVFIGFVFSAGAGAIEAYIERVSRSRGFEYGKARMFGCLGWALCAAMAGMLFNVDPSLVFWMGSGSALLLLLLLFLARPSTSQTAMVMNTLGANSSLISTRMVFSLFRMRQMWMFVSLHDWCGLCL